MMISLGTSLAIIIPTAFSGAYRHTRVMEGIISPGVKLGIFGIVGGIIGGLIASYIPSKVLEIIFGFLLLFIAIYNLFTINKEESKSKIKFNLISALVIGISVGILSGLLGIGGGIFLIVILTFLLGFKMINATGISSIFICLTATGGVSSYILTGLGVNTFPYSIGYVSLVNLLMIAIFSVPLAYYGAKVSHKVPEKRLKQVFSILVFYISLKMLGVFP